MSFLEAEVAEVSLSGRTAQRDGLWQQQHNRTTLKHPSTCIRTRSHMCLFLETEFVLDDAVVDEVGRSKRRCCLPSIYPPIHGHAALARMHMRSSEEQKRAKTPLYTSRNDDVRETSSAPFFVPKSGERASENGKRT